MKLGFTILLVSNALQHKSSSTSNHLAAALLLSLIRRKTSLVSSVIDNGESQSILS